MPQQFLKQKVVVDLRSPFVCLGTLTGVDESYLELQDADLHDLRDTKTSRENYVVAAKTTGIKHNRKRIYLVRADVVAIGLLSDVME
jgi:hypothetical protein